MRLRPLLLAGLLGASPVLAGETNDPDLFHSEVARLELRKPHGWHYQSLESALTNRANVKLKDKEFERAIQESARMPLLIVTKHEEPYDRLNATLQVLVRPAGPAEGKSGEEVLRLVLPMLRMQFADYSEVKGVTPITVSGKPAARTTVRYTLKTQDGREFPTQATLVMVPRGKVLYQFGFSGPRAGPDVWGAEVDSVLASVRFLE